ncbi:hypothetical protein ACFL2V_04485 [Pseudomonadota bacterium]
MYDAGASKGPDQAPPPGPQVSEAGGEGLKPKEQEATEKNEKFAKLRTETLQILQQYIDSGGDNGELLEKAKTAKRVIEEQTADPESKEKEKYQNLTPEEVAKQLEFFQTILDEFSPKEVGLSAAIEASVAEPDEPKVEPAEPSAAEAKEEDEDLSPNMEELKQKIAHAESLLPFFSPSFRPPGFTQAINNARDTFAQKDESRVEERTKDLNRAIDVVVGLLRTKIVKGRKLNISVEDLGTPKLAKLAEEYRPKPKPPAKPRMAKGPKDKSAEPEREKTLAERIDADNEVVKQQEEAEALKTAKNELAVKVKQARELKRRAGQGPGFGLSATLGSTIAEATRVWRDGTLADVQMQSNLLDTALGTGIERYNANSAPEHKIASAEDLFRRPGKAAPGAPIEDRVAKVGEAGTEAAPQGAKTAPEAKEGAEYTPQLLAFKHLKPADQKALSLEAKAALEAYIGERGVSANQELTIPVVYKVGGQEYVWVFKGGTNKVGYPSITVQFGMPTGPVAKAEAAAAEAAKPAAPEAKPEKPADTPAPTATVEAPTEEGAEEAEEASEPEFANEDAAGFGNWEKAKRVAIIDYNESDPDGLGPMSGQEFQNVFAEYLEGKEAEHDTGRAEVSQILLALDPPPKNSNGDLIFAEDENNPQAVMTAFIGDLRLGNVSGESMDRLRSALAGEKPKAKPKKAPAPKAEPAVEAPAPTPTVEEPAAEEPPEEAPAEPEAPAEAEPVKAEEPAEPVRPKMTEEQTAALAGELDAATAASTDLGAPTDHGPVRTEATLPATPAEEEKPPEPEKRQKVTIDREPPTGTTGATATLEGEAVAPQVRGPSAETPETTTESYPTLSEADYKKMAPLAAQAGRAELDTAAATNPDKPYYEVRFTVAVKKGEKTYNIPYIGTRRGNSDNFTPDRQKMREF